MRGLLPSGEILLRESWGCMQGRYRSVVSGEAGRDVCCSGPLGRKCVGDECGGRRGREAHFWGRGAGGERGDVGLREALMLVMAVAVVVMRRTRWKRTSFGLAGRGMRFSGAEFFFRRGSTEGAWRFCPSSEKVVNLRRTAGSSLQTALIFNLLSPSPHHHNAFTHVVPRLPTPLKASKALPP